MTASRSCQPSHARAPPHSTARRQESPGGGETNRGSPGRCNVHRAIVIVPLRFLAIPHRHARTADTRGVPMAVNPALVGIPVGLAVLLLLIVGWRDEMFWRKN